MTVVVFSPTADGVIAALLAPLFMSIGFFIWDVRWTASGGSAFALNMYKCLTASIGFVIMCGIRGFSQSNADGAEVFTSSSVGFLLLSSTLGIIIGDVLWLEALRLIGAKHVIVIDSIKPFAAAILGRFFLQETLKLVAWGGMILTVLGIGVVSWEEQTRAAKPEEDVGETNTVQIESTQQIIMEGHTDDRVDRNKRYRRGYTCAVFNVLADSFGSLLTKQHGVGMTTWTINLIRFGFAGMILFSISCSMRVHRKYCSTAEEQCLQIKNENRDTEATAHMDDSTRVEEQSQRTKDVNREETDTNITCQSCKWYLLPPLHLKGWLQITAGVALVTFLCPAFEKFALFQITLALAISLSSVGPLYGLLMDWPFKGKKPTLPSCFGACMAIGGVVVLSVFGT